MNGQDSTDYIKNILEMVQKISNKDKDDCATDKKELITKINTIIKSIEERRHASVNLLHEVGVRQNMIKADVVNLNTSLSLAKQRNLFGANDDADEIKLTEKIKEMMEQSKKDKEECDKHLDKIEKLEKENETLKKTIENLEKNIKFTDVNEKLSKENIVLKEKNKTLTEELKKISELLEVMIQQKEIIGNERHKINQELFDGINNLQENVTWQNDQLIKNEKDIRELDEMNRLMTSKLNLRNMEIASEISPDLKTKMKKELEKKIKELSEINDEQLSEKEKMMKEINEIKKSHEESRFNYENLKKEHDTMLKLSQDIETKIIGTEQNRYETLKKKLHDLEELIKKMEYDALELFQQINDGTAKYNLLQVQYDESEKTKQLVEEALKKTKISMGVCSSGKNMTNSVDFYKNVDELLNLMTVLMDGPGILTGSDKKKMSDIIEKVRLSKDTASSTSSALIGGDLKY